jgi:hypothetical protein
VLFWTLLIQKGFNIKKMIEKKRETDVKKEAGLSYENPEWLHQ